MVTKDRSFPEPEPPPPPPLEVDESLITYIERGDPADGEQHSERSRQDENGNAANRQ